MTPSSKFKPQNSKFHNLAPNALSSVIYILFLSLYFLHGSELAGCSDIGWHLKAGEIIRSLGYIPDSDSWSYTAGDYEWLNISWLFDVIISYINDLFGIEGLIAIFAITGAFIIALISHICLKENNGIIPVFITIFITALFFKKGLLIRPQIITFISTFAFFHILKITNKSEYGTKKLIFLPLLMIIWINIHGGFLLGFLFLGAYGLEALIEKKWIRFKQLILISVLCGIALFINPLGWNLIPAVFRTLHSELALHIEEWRAVKILSDILATTHFIIFIISANRTKETSFGEYAICIGMLLLGLYQIRNYVIFVLISAPYISSNLSHLMNSSSLEFLKQKEQEFAKDFSSEKAKKSAFITALILTVFLSLPFTRNIAIPQNKFGWPKEEIPFKSMEFIQKNYPNIRYYNRYRYGGYLIYFTDIKVFIDGRAETAYHKEAVQDFLKMVTLSNGWEEVIEKYNIEGIFLPNDDWRNDHFENSSKWQKVFEGEIASVYIKTELVK